MTDTGGVQHFFAKEMFNLETDSTNKVVKLIRLLHLLKFFKVAGCNIHSNNKLQHCFKMLV